MPATATERRLAVAAAILAAAVAGPVRAGGEPAPPADRFEAAADRLAAGDHRAAAEAFVRVADGAPGARLAEDALFTAATIYEDRLAEPGRAAALYERLVRRYPDGRASLAAERRLAALRDALGPAGAGAEPLARFSRIRGGHRERPESASIAMAEELVAGHPDWPGVPRVLAWLASIDKRAGRVRRARRRYVRIVNEWPDSERAASAHRSAGDLSLALGEPDVAERLYRQMPVAGDPSAGRSKAEALERLRAYRARHRTATAAAAAIAVAAIALVVSLRVAAGSTRAAMRALARPPPEVVYLAPVAAVVTGAAYTGHATIGPAVLVMCAGGLALTHLSGAGLAAARDAGRPSRGRPAAHAALTLAAAIAIVYLALHQENLLDLIRVTVRFGPDT